MKNVIFDVDDTLYDLMEAFDKVHKEFLKTRPKKTVKNFSNVPEFTVMRRFIWQEKEKSVTTMNLHTAFRRLIKTLGLK